MWDSGLNNQSTLVPWPLFQIWVFDPYRATELTSEVLWKIPENKLYFNIIWEESLAARRSRRKKKPRLKKKKESGDGKTFLITWKYRAHHHAASQLYCELFSYWHFLFKPRSGGLLLFVTERDMMNNIYFLKVDNQILPEFPKSIVSN